MQIKQCQQHLKAINWNSQEGWGGSILPLIVLPSNPEGFIVPKESCWGVGLPWCAKCFFLFLWLWIHCDWYSLVCSDDRKHGMTRRAAWNRVFCAQEQAKWALPMWQCGTFQAQMNKKGKSTWMHMQISEHTVVLKKKSKKYTVNPRTCSFSSLTCTNTAWHTVCLARQFT